MIALKSDGRTYLASAVRARNDVGFSIVDRDVVNSVRWFQNDCYNSMGPHRWGGRCAEPNVLRLYADENGMTDDDPKTVQEPSQDKYLAAHRRLGPLGQRPTPPEQGNVLPPLPRQKSSLGLHQIQGLV
jgi:hypothetical protein